MAKGLVLLGVLCVLVHALSAASPAAVRASLTRQHFAHLQADIDEWKRLGKPTSGVFQHNATGGVEGLLIAMPQDSPALLGTNYAANIIYYLYNRDNVEKPVLVGGPTAKALVEAGFNPDIPTKIITHGFTNDITSELFSVLVPAALETGDFNIIAVDWGYLARAPFYIEARNHVGGVGKQVAKLIDTLVLELRQDLSQMHVLGHSLGAHVMGNAGRGITTGKLGRITALDPALPLFLILTSDRVRESDANLVDVVHSCGGFLGLTEAIGTVDFYPNGGSWPQPGCGMDLVGTCSHGRGVYYYAESAFEAGSFPARECSSARAAERGDDRDCSKKPDGNLGFNLRFDSNGAGTYYLSTATSSPYDLQVHKKAQEEAAVAGTSKVADKAAH